MKNKSSRLKTRFYPEEPSPKNRIIRFSKLVYRKLHLDKSIWNLILLSIIGFSVVSVLRQTDIKTPEGQSNILSTAAIIGAAGALLWTANGIHNQYHDALLSRSSQYVEAWYSEDFNRALHVIRALTWDEFDKKHDGKPSILEDKNIVPVLELKYGGLESLRKLSNAQTEIAKRIISDKEIKESVGKIIDFFEQMGMDVKFKIVDSEYLKDFFYLIAIRYYELFRKYIEYMQNFYDSRFIYCNFVYLAQTWEKEAYAPSIPKICVRKTILTKEECELLSSSKNAEDGKSHMM